MCTAGSPTRSQCLRSSSRRKRRRADGRGRPIRPDRAVRLGLSGICSRGGNQRCGLAHGGRDGRRRRGGIGHSGGRMVAPASASACPESRAVGFGAGPPAGPGRIVRRDSRLLSAVHSLRLLSRVGATTRQLLFMTGWQAFTLSVTGIGLGIVFGAASVLVITKVLTSSWTPNVTWPPVVIIIAGVLALTTLSVFIPTSWILSEPDYD
jgi:hypothetical protein